MHRAKKRFLFCGKLSNIYKVAPTSNAVYKWDESKEKGDSKHSQRGTTLKNIIRTDVLRNFQWSYFPFSDVYNLRRNVVKVIHKE